MKQGEARGLSPKHAARYLGVSEQTLRKQRSCPPERGMPPVPYARAGRRIIYLIEDLDQWLDDRRNADGREPAEAPDARRAA